MRIAPTESITIWEEILIDLQERGVKNVLLFITDGLKGMAGAVQRFYPKARFQHCCVHVSRNISHKVRVDDRKEVCDDFKMVYQASSKKAHWKHVVLLRKNGKPVIQKWWNRSFRTITCSLSMIFH